MSRFAVAGIQMKVSSVQSNVEMMKLKLDITMNLYPWVQMVVFSELCGYGPLTHTAQEFPGAFEAEMQEMARKYEIWLLPGSVFEKRGEETLQYRLRNQPAGRDRIALQQDVSLLSLRRGRVSGA